MSTINNTFKRTYQRSEILSFHELDDKQQLIAIDLLDERAEHDRYVLYKDEPLPISMFLLANNGLFGGVYSLSAFSAYFIKINKTGDQATVCYAHC